jgi:flagellar motor switch protein FliN/FliY
MASEQDDRRLDGSDGLTPLEAGSLSALSGLALPVLVRIGTAEMTVGELLRVGPGAVITLDRHVDEPVEVLVGDRIVARGELVSVDDEMGVRITEIAETAHSGEPAQ